MALMTDKTRYHVVPTSSSSKVESEILEASVDFETAVSATGYGTFNVLLLIAVVPVGWTAVFDTSSVAFVLPVAECEFDLDLYRKGALAAVIYAGMICAALAWGYVADYTGRKTLLLFGLTSDAILNIFGSASQNYYVYLVFKFLNGVIVGGPYAVLVTYVAEFHGERHRARVIMWTGSLFAVGNIAVPALARAILPLPWSFSMFDDSLVFDSWRIFLIICGIPSALGIFSIIAFPESPKFLMTKGKFDEALRVFRKMYAMNTGKSEDTYPVKALAENKPRSSARSRDARRASSNDTGKASTKSVFAVPYVVPLFIVNSILFASMTGLHVMKAWLPQLIVILNNFNLDDWDDSRGPPTLCDKFDTEAIELFRTKTKREIYNSTQTCIPMDVATAVYTNATIIAASATIGSILTGFIINKIGKKSILLLSLLLSGAFYVALKWTPSTTVFLILSSFIVALLGISSNTMTAMIVDFVPTSLRATSMSVSTMTGRIGALTGNLLFPILLNVSCGAPFYYMGGLLAFGFILATFLSKDSQSLQ